MPSFSLCLGVEPLVDLSLRSAMHAMLVQCHAGQKTQTSGPQIMVLVAKRIPIYGGKFQWWLLEASNSNRPTIARTNHLTIEPPSSSPKTRSSDPILAWTVNYALPLNETIRPTPKDRQGDRPVVFAEVLPSLVVLVWCHRQFSSNLGVSL